VTSQLVAGLDLEERPDRVNWSAANKSRSFVGTGGSVAGGRLVAQGRMSAVVVVIVFPVGDHHTDLRQRPEAGDAEVPAIRLLPRTFLLSPIPNLDSTVDENDEPARSWIGQKSEISCSRTRPSCWFNSGPARGPGQGRYLFPDSKLLRFFLDFVDGAFVLAVHDVARLVDRRVHLVGILRQ
jgi:hypothetical protein